ncbi:hypothetical protein RP20_CCG007170 [Aedes albopictus]|nr:hypothetical protein RP20_CCG007170 [Aedes albopictus]
MCQSAGDDEETEHTRNFESSMISSAVGRVSPSKDKRKEVIIINVAGARKGTIALSCAVGPRSNIEVLLRKPGEYSDDHVASSERTFGAINHSGKDGL